MKFCIIVLLEAAKQRKKSELYAMGENNLTQLLHIYDQEFYLPGQAEESMPMATMEPVKVLVLANPDDLSVEHRELLARMLKACLLAETDYVVLPSDTDLLITHIRQYQPQYVIMFGLNLESPSFHAQKEKYKPFRFADKKFLLGDTLRDMAASPALKSALWTQGLKPLFNIP